MFIAALFAIAKMWKPPICTSTDKWIKKMWHIHTMEYYSALINKFFNKQGNSSICNNMDKA